jgi:hypothetical protein
VNCLKCGQRLQIPRPVPVTAGKTVLARPIPVPAVAASAPPGRTERPRSRQTTRVLVGFGVGLLLFGAGILIVMTILRVRDPQSAEKQLVVEYLTRTAEDPKTVEIAEWLPSRSLLLGRNRRDGDQNEKLGISSYTPATVLHARYREKNLFGSFTLRERLFLIRAGAVTSAPIRAGLSVDQAVIELAAPFAAEAINGKWNRVVLRGRVLRNGRPVEQPFWLSLNNENGVTEGGELLEAVAEADPWQKAGRGGQDDRYAIHAITAPPLYEASSLTPGTYRVTVESTKTKVVSRVSLTDQQPIQQFDIDVAAAKE